MITCQKRKLSPNIFKHYSFRFDGCFYMWSINNLFYFNKNQASLLRPPDVQAFVQAYLCVRIFRRWTRGLHHTRASPGLRNVVQAEARQGVSREEPTGSFLYCARSKLPPMVSGRIRWPSWICEKAHQNSVAILCIDKGRQDRERWIAVGVYSIFTRILQLRRLSKCRWPIT